MGLSLTTMLSRLIHGSVLLLLPGLLAVLPMASSPSAAEESSLDIRLTLRARQAIMKDAILSKLRMGVSVKNETVHIWGDVIHPDDRRRAEQVVGQVPGIVDVRNDLRLLTPQDPVRELVELEQKTQPRVALLHRPAGQLTSQPPLPLLLTQPPELAVTLLPPTGPPVPSAKPDDLSASVARLTGSDPRFRSLLPTIDGGIVRLGGTAGRWQDVMELAQLISRLDGVERVIVESK